MVSSRLDFACLRLSQYTYINRPWRPRALSLTSTLVRGEWSTSHSGRFNPANDPVPILQEAGWAPGSAWKCAENLAHTGILPRTVQPVVSCHTYRAIPAYDAESVADYAAWIIRQKIYERQSCCHCKSITWEGWGNLRKKKSALRAFSDRNAKQFALRYKRQKLPYANFKQT